MISLTPLIALINQARPAGFERDWFREVGGAAEFAKIAAVTVIPLPGCWLVRAADSAKPAGERAEDLALAFDVVIGITNERVKTAGETDDELLRYRRAVHTLLLGWRFPKAPAATPTAPNPVLTRPITFGGGQVIEYTDGDLWWRDRYQFIAHQTNYLPDPPAFAGIQNPKHLTGETL